MSKNNRICGKCKGVESYTYIRNQPKNMSQVILGSGPQYMNVQPTATFRITENYNYGYDYAMYRPEKHETMPTQKEENAWPGVI
jgi:hypothetical protein